MSYKVHHLSCGSMCFGSAKLFAGKGGLFEKMLLSCHCLLIETDEGLVLVDTGFGYKDIIEPTFPFSQISKKLMNVQVSPEDCAYSQIKRLGYSPSEVRHIILTHADLDHAGGIMDFPHAQVHMLNKELDAIQEPATLWEKTRYLPYLWQHKPLWKPHAPAGERWFGFEAVQVLSNTLYDILLIPLTGHSRGHCGIAVSTDQGWLLHCGDAYMHRAELSFDPKQKSPLGVQMLHAMDDVCRAERIANQRRLKALNQQHGNEVELICSHDHGEFHSCQHRERALAKISYS